MNNCDNLDKYLRYDIEDELSSSPLRYWIEHIEDLLQKDLSKMVIDIFSIPAMSADLEQPFSRYSTITLAGNSLHIYARDMCHHGGEHISESKLPE